MELDNSQYRHKRQTGTAEPYTQTDTQPIQFAHLYTHHAPSSNVHGFPAGARAHQKIRTCLYRLVAIIQNDAHAVLTRYGKGPRRLDEEL
eukprot:1155570-Pelagomonas_calceolata.AAC.2